MNDEKIDLELYHHGILGQKWGIRRYQNEDGSLTEKGKKRYATKSNFEKVMAAKRAASHEALKAKRQREKAEERTKKEIEKYRKKAGLDKKDEDKEVNNVEKNNKEVVKQNTKKPISEMTNQEINERLERIRLENELRSKDPEYREKTKKEGRKFSNFVKKDVVEDVVLPSAKKAGKNWLLATLNEKLGLNVKDDPKFKDKNDNKDKDDSKDKDDISDKIKDMFTKKQENESKKESKKEAKKESKKEDNKWSVEGEGKSKFEERTKDKNYYDEEWVESVNESIKRATDYISENKMLLLEDLTKRRW